MAERVWEKFLTEQDKATLTGKADRRIGFGERPALLLIDLYRWVFGDKPEAVTEAIKTWPGSCGLAGWNALPHIAAMLSSTRSGILFLTEGAYTERELMLIKVRAVGKERDEMKRMAEFFRGRIIDVTRRATPSS